MEIIYYGIPIPTQEQLAKIKELSDNGKIAELRYYLDTELKPVDIGIYIPERDIMSFSLQQVKVSPDAIIEWLSKFEIYSKTGEFHSVDSFCKKYSGSKYETTGDTLKWFDDNWKPLK